MTDIEMKLQGEVYAPYSCATGEVGARLPETGRRIHRHVSEWPVLRFKMQKHLSLGNYNPIHIKTGAVMLATHCFLGMERRYRSGKGENLPFHGLCFQSRGKAES